MKARRKEKRKRVDRTGDLYYVDIGYACFSVTVRRGIVTFAAPIERWMVGKEWLQVRKWIEERGIWEKVN